MGPLAQDVLSSHVGLPDDDTLDVLDSIFQNAGDIIFPCKF